MHHHTFIGVLVFRNHFLLKILERKEEFLKEMRLVAKKKQVSMVILMMTDVLLEGSHILYKKAPIRTSDGCYL